MTMDWKTWGIEAGSSVDEAVIALVQQHLGVNLPPLYWTWSATPTRRRRSGRPSTTAASKPASASSSNSPRRPSPIRCCGTPPASAVAGADTRPDPHRPRRRRSTGVPEHHWRRHHRGAVAPTADTYPVAADFQQFVEQWRP